MNEYYQKRILAIIDRELTIDKKIRVELHPIINSLSKDKKNNLNLSLETTQNKHFKYILSKIKDELCKIPISDIDETILNPLVQNRIDEILELNLTRLSENEQKEINNNLNVFQDFTKHIDKNKY